KSAADYFHDLLFDQSNPAAVATLEYARKKRGLTDETLHHFAIGYAPQGWQNSLDALKGLGYTDDDLIATGIASHNEETGRIYDRFRHRLMIPIRDERGRVVGFGARALAADDNPKYLNSPQSALFDKSRLLFGLDFAKQAIRDSETAVIVEGYLDVIQAHQAGYANVVAQMGTALTEPQLKLLAPRLAKRIILSLDSDAAGQSATRRSLEVARETLQADYAGRLSVDIRILVVPGAKDPDDLIREAPEQWTELIKGALPVADYVIASEMETLPENATVQERESVARRLLPILLASENDLYKNDNLQKLALRLHIAERDLLMWAAEQQKIAAARPPRPAQQTELSPAFPPEAEPELPFSYGDEEPDFDTPRLDRRGQASPEREAELEKLCLRMFILQPKLIYDVNRKFRELAGMNSALFDGALGDFDSGDFTRTSYRALMDQFLRAIAQDEMEPRDYLQSTLQPDLLDELEDLLADEWDELRPRLHHGLSVDLNIVIKQVERFNTALDPVTEVVEKALRLRLKSLERERQEMMFSGMFDEVPYQKHINLSMLAMQLMNKELNRRVQLLRQ
ncbi:MAG: toprim domain-containing protein, partial [Chloroflexota bacterium]